MMKSIVFLVIICSMVGQVKAEEGTLQNELLNLCERKDTVFFSCETKKGKFISLCGKESNNKWERIYYRFGRINKIELEYPEINIKDNETLNLFYYSYYARALVSYSTVSFNNNDYVYLIQDLRNHESIKNRVTQNLIVRSIFDLSNDNLSNGNEFSCVSSVISNIHLLSGTIPCDEKYSLGCQH